MTPPPLAGQPAGPVIGGTIPIPRQLPPPMPGGVPPLVRPPLGQVPGAIPPGGRPPLTPPPIATPGVPGGVRPPLAPPPVTMPPGVRAPVSPPVTMPPVTPPAGGTAPSRLAAFQVTWVGKDADVVNKGGEARPDGSPDAHFRVQTTFSFWQDVTHLALYSSDASGNPSGGQGWHTQNASYWLLAALYNNMNLNARHVARLGTFNGPLTIDLYAGDSGYFTPGQNFVVEMGMSGSQAVAQVVQAGAAGPPPVTGGGLPPVTGVVTPGATATTWATNAADHRGKVGQRFSYACPSGGGGGSVWGTDVYTDDTSVCTAAVHAGLITFASGGTVTVEIRPGQSSYTGSLRNGVQSANYGTWGGSYVFSGAGGAPPVAGGGPVTQSSVSEFSGTADPSEDAKGALDGVKNGGFGFHTASEANPWWRTDLGQLVPLREVRLYNRLDCCAERSRTVQVHLSADGSNWQLAYAHNGTTFGGADGRPLVVDLRGRSARYVMLRLTETAYFHLDEVEIIRDDGTPPPPPPPPTFAGTLRTDSATYIAGQPITLTFSGFPGTNDWIALAPAGAAPESYGEWKWTDGSSTAGGGASAPRRDGTLTYTAPAPGTYEFRVFVDWPTGAHTARATAPITVRAADVFTSLPADFPSAWQWESQGGWRGGWTRRGATDVFDAWYLGPNGERVTTVEEMTRLGDRVRNRRVSSSDNNLCNLEGTIRSGGVIDGTGECPGINSGWTWRLTVGAATPPPPPATWATNATDHRGQNGQRFDYACPPGGAGGSVWGTDVYTDDTSVCTAAVHVGLITFASGGRVTIEIRAGESSYRGSQRNGVQSSDYGSWSGSFFFPAATPSPPVAGNACGRTIGTGIFDKWQSLGGEGGFLGCPSSDEREATTSPQGTTGTFASFTGATGLIVWHRNGSRAMQAYEVHGDISVLYYGMGGSGSWLGFPVSDEYDAAGGRRSDFEGGYIFWDASSRATTAYRYGEGPEAPPPPVFAGSVRTDRDAYAEGEAITVNFAGFPTTNDWIAIAPAGAAAESYGEWHWTDGSNTSGAPAGAPRSAGSLSFAGLPTGNYEVRVFIDWPNGGHAIRTSYPFTVQGGGPRDLMLSYSADFVGMDADAVGQWASGTPDGTPDGHFRFYLDYNYPFELKYITVYGSDANGNPLGGKGTWHSQNPGYWMLGVAQGANLLNSTHAASLGSFQAHYGPFDLYANDYGTFRSGEYFTVEAGIGGGEPLRQVVQIPPGFLPNVTGQQAELPFTGTMATDRTAYAEGQPITVTFYGFPGTPDWIAIAPQGAAPESYGEWHWTDGSTTSGAPAGQPQPQGTLQYQGLAAGNYEVRAFTNWPAGGHTIRAAVPFTVAPAVQTAQVAMDAAWIGVDADVVSKGATGSPDGEADGHFAIQLAASSAYELRSIAVSSADAQGAQAGGQYWWSNASGNVWILGVV
ncbi:MAG: LCCL domain-containing protein, partial [Gemmatimonadota bacterium]